MNGEARARVQKCKMCYRTVARASKTACAEACPAEATTFGDRDALIAEARSRINANPGQYIDYIYGLEEAGGTS